MDNSYWYPFTFLKDNKPSGVHVDIVTMALKASGYDLYTIKSGPWRRCLKEAQFGMADAVMTASYKPERADYLYYPEDAQSSSPSKWRVSQVGYSAVLLPGANFNGNMSHLPQPVYVPHGYSIGDDIKKSGVTVDSTFYSDLRNFNRLNKLRKGSLVTITTLAQAFLRKNPSYQMVIYPKEIKSKSYFLAFSKKSFLSPSEQQAIWEKIRLIRKKELNNIMVKYVK
ncbi:substrate-binding periplasmic protein [Piscirickettsia litoralis]|nr:transporter substrate-binding domain-containing protein [Piscirickettsia litoralis]